MNPLVIKLTGKIQSSNFDEWKCGLITRIHSINTDLKSDNDFVTATNQVKSFKTAESALKEAKQDALTQAEEINRLFGAIDEVAAETRQVRLSLERQIKARKMKIREAAIDEAITAVQGFISRQSADFQTLSHSDYLDRSRFKTAIKAKGGVRGVQNALGRLCREIESEITQKAAEVCGNAAQIDALPEEYWNLFPDRDILLRLSEQELELTIENRIARLREGNSRSQKETIQMEPGERPPPGRDGGRETEPDGGVTGEKGKYRVVLEVLASKQDAVEIARAIKYEYGERQSILNIRLIRG